jgi:hypothetical protein
VEEVRGAWEVGLEVRAGAELAGVVEGVASEEDEGGGRDAGEERQMAGKVLLVWHLFVE